MNNFKRMLDNLEPLLERSFYINTKTKKELVKHVKTTLSASYKTPSTFFYIYLGSVYCAATDKLYRESLKTASYIYLDGFLIAWLKNINAEVVNLNYLNEVLIWCSKKNKKVFLLGAKEKVLSQAINNIRKKYPKIKVSGYHGYFSDNKNALRKINDYKPELLIVSMGLGKQEKWIYKNKNKLKNTKVIIAGGIFADIWGGEKIFFPEVYKTLKIRWLYRLAKEPKRLYKRYIISLLLLVGHVYLKFSKR